MDFWLVTSHIKRFRKDHGKPGVTHSLTRLITNIKHIIQYMFFWVFLRRQIVVGRRFGTLCQFHLQRLGVEYTLHTAFEDGTDAEEIPKRTYTIFKSRRKFEIKNRSSYLLQYTEILIFLSEVSIVAVLNLTVQPYI